MQPQGLHRGETNAHRPQTVARRKSNENGPAGGGAGPSSYKLEREALEAVPRFVGKMVIAE
jgi:hypothetical protein